MTRVHHVVFVVGPPGVGKTTALRKIALPSECQTPDTEVRWTITPPFAFIGHYEDKILDGGDRVARHANLLCLEYWRRNIVTDPRIKVTFIDGEMYLWHRILESFRSPSLRFVREDEAHYLPGGRYHTTFKQIQEADPDRFPEPPGLDKSLPQVRVHCIYLNCPLPVALERRRTREANAEEGATINSDRHMKTAASKQRNFGARFKEASEPGIMGMFGAHEDDLPSYLELDAENLSPDRVVEVIRNYALGLEVF